ncbi:MAG: histidine kinase dimerization/phosphoacceptor domain -containing protein [Methanoregula sp.]|jgi:two-component sensor histidine kinase
MSTEITRVELRYEQDVVSARSRARIIAEQLGFDKSDQTRISTAVSEMARNMFQYAGGGEIEFLIDTSRKPNEFTINVRDPGKDVPQPFASSGGRGSAETRMEEGIQVSKLLMDDFRIDTRQDGTTISMGKNLPLTALEVPPTVLTAIADVLVKSVSLNPFDEIQNQELVRALENLRSQREELARVNRELDETNRGVMALYVELDNNAVSLSKANKALRESEEELKRNATLLNDVSEMAQVGGWELDVTTKEIRWTQETYRIHEIAGNEKIDLPKAIHFYDLPGRSTMEAALQRCMVTEEPFDLDLPFTSASGKHLWVRAMGRAVKAGEKVVKVTGTFQDITERKAADETIRTFGENLERQVTDRTADLSDSNLKLITEIGIRLDAEKKLTKNVGEKEALLREVHHRVKNNLQIIISLLNLQSRFMTDEGTLSAFRESQSRIKVMALVHEKLYQSTDLEKIDLESYRGFRKTPIVLYLSTDYEKYGKSP